MAAGAEDLNLTFPGDPRFVTVVKEAVATAVRSTGCDATRADRAATAVQQFLESCLADALRSPIAVRISDTAVHVAVQPRTMNLDF